MQRRRIQPKRVAHGSGGSTRMRNIISRACRFFFQAQTMSGRVGYPVPNLVPNAQEPVPISQSGSPARVLMPKCAVDSFGQWLC